MSVFPPTIDGMSKPRPETVIFYSALGVSVLIHVWALALWALARMPRQDAGLAVSSANVTYFADPSPLRSEFIQDQGEGHDHAPDIQTLLPEKTDRPDADLLFHQHLTSGIRLQEPDFLSASGVSDRPEKYLSDPVTDPGRKHSPEPSRHDKSSFKVPLQKISIPMIASGSIRPDNYPEYFNRIGERIRKKAYRMTEGMGRIAGEVRVNFVLRPDGQLSEIRAFRVSGVIDQRLLDLVTDIVRASAPFEVFPREMGNKDLSCEVVIEFQLDYDE